VQEVDQVEVVDEGVGDLDEDRSQPLGETVVMPASRLVPW
jgi:hypothetical protein